MRVRDGIIGHRESNHVMYFTGSDSQDNLNKKLKTQPADWYYRTANISYSLNSLGHRCKELDEIDFDNYILTVGCSHSEGVGLELEKTYPYLLSSRLGCDYYNLSVGGSGIDLLIHNITVWLNRYKHPKALIVQWPHHARFLSADADLDRFSISDDVILEPHGPWRQGNIIEMLLIGEELNYFKTIRDLAKIKIDSFTIPTVHVTPEYDGIYPSDAISIIRLDNARDNHYGMLSHEALSIAIHNQLIAKHKFNHK